MNWLTNFVRPKIRSLIGKDVPDNLWVKCASCEHMVFHKEIEANFFVCTNCGYHMRISVKNRIKLLFDDAKVSYVKIPDVPVDPLKFKDTKKYTDRLKSCKSDTGFDDSVVVCSGKINGNKVVAAIFEFNFMGGSMGMKAGEAIVVGVEKAIDTNSAFLAIPCSGGARMQEGVLSLMQMPRTIIALNKLKETKLPYIVLLTNPTTGGVSASFAMLGDVHIAEPKAIIAFTGARVIEGTIREKLPEGFQCAEYLLEHGMIDMVVERKNLKEKIGQLLTLFTNNS